MTDLYPYTETYAELIEPVELHVTKHRPREVLLARGVQNPQGVLTGYAGTMLDGSRANSEILIDFGRAVVGQAALQITVLDAGVLQLAYGETIDEALGVAPTTDWYTPPADHFARSSGPWVVRSKARRAFRYLLLRVPEGQGQVRIEAVWAQHGAYGAPMRGAFSCSDPALNAIWRMSERTLANTMQRYYEDGVKRDGLLWISDYRVGYLANAMSYGDATLARNSLLMIAASQRQDGALPACAARGGGHQHPHAIDYMPGIPHGGVDGWVLINQCCDFVSALKEYVIYSGDRQLLATLFPTLTRLVRFLTADLDLVNLAPGQDFVTDRQPDAGDAWWCSRGALAMQLYWAMGDAALMANWLKIQEVVSVCSTTASLLRRLALRSFYDRDRRVFLDSKGLMQTSWHINALALLAGMRADETSGADLLKRVYALDDARYPLTGLMQFWHLAAQFAAQSALTALEGTRAYWGAMRSQGASTCWESVDVKMPERRSEHYPMSYCHTWSSGPLYLLPRFVLGVQPAGLGFGQVRIAPQLGDLDWAEGIVPTPHGDIVVRWEARPQLHGWITLPEGIHGQAVVALASSSGDRAVEVVLAPGENRIN